MSTKGMRGWPFRAGKGEVLPQRYGARGGERNRVLAQTITFAGLCRPVRGYSFSNPLPIKLWFANVPDCCNRRRGVIPT